jgi:hypothetical protein
MEHNEKDCHPLIDLSTGILHIASQSDRDSPICCDNNSHDPINSHSNSHIDRRVHTDPI